MHRFEYIKYVFFTNSNRSGVQILQYLIKRQSTNAMKSDLFLIPKNNITWAKLKDTAVLKKINVSNAIQLKAYSTLPNKSTGTAIFQTLFPVCSFLGRYFYWFPVLHLQLKQKISTTTSCSVWYESCRYNIYSFFLIFRWAR